VLFSCGQVVYSSDNFIKINEKLHNKIENF